MQKQSANYSTNARRASPVIPVSVEHRSFLAERFIPSSPDTTTRDLLPYER
jgi:hypothetical protein